MELNYRFAVSRLDLLLFFLGNIRIRLITTEYSVGTLIRCDELLSQVRVESCQYDCSQCANHLQNVNSSAISISLK